MEQKRIDLPSPEIAIEVQALIEEDYYRAILRALQDAVAEHGFQFVMDESGERTIRSGRASLSAEAMASMARTVNRHRQLWLSPKMDEAILCGHLDRDADEGYDHVWLTGLLNALLKLGITLVPTSSGEM